MSDKNRKYVTTSVLFEMLGSFSSLARTLNLTQTTEELGVSRQTIRRHIRDLEELRGAPLFNFHERKYSLTEFGKEALVEAEMILLKAKYWTCDQTSTVNGLYAGAEILEDQTPFYVQQHKLSDIWRMAPPIIIEGFRAWASSGFQLEAPEMLLIRDYLAVFRKRNSEWICTEMGDNSAVASWRGLAAARSAVGTVFDVNPLGIDATRSLMDAHESVIRTGGAWYDHISTRQQREPKGAKYPVHYQRLVLYFEFPDGQPAAASLSARTNKIEISNMPSSDFQAMPESDLMDSIVFEKSVKS